MTSPSIIPLDADDLPPVVWARVLALAAQALPALASPPVSLRKVATFTASRRVRLGGPQIGQALAEEAFRERVGTQVAAALPEVTEALRAGAVDDADPVDLAAVAWLARPEGWESALADVVRRIAAHQEATGASRDQEELARLRARLTDVEAAAREQQARQREALSVARSEISDLRRRLGEARSSERSSRAAGEQAQREAEEVRLRAAAAAAAADTEVRRLRAQVADLTAAVAAARRAARGERDDATVRARILLDTLIEAGQGLRRELALPTGEGSPADRLEAELSGSSEPSVRTSSGAGALGPDSPALLEHYLGLPRARLVVDGYNVTKLARPDSSLESQRTWLLSRLAALVARTGADTIVVFDAADSTDRPPVSPPRGVKVTFSPPGVIADDVIRNLVAVEPAGRVVVVVTSDRAVGDDVRQTGARVVTATALLGVVGR